MKRYRRGICGAVMVVCGLCLASKTARATDLQLIPQPREVKEAGGAAFAVTRHTRIVVDDKFGREFQGAQVLSDEIERWTGWKPKISDAREMPGGSDIIYIGDATGDSRLREALGTSGLAMQNGFDAQGYAISADSHRILVGGASEQGAFYGVQTLRQLLRPDANGGLACVAVGIRDWPAMKWRGVSIDISRGPIPKLSFMENQIRVLAGFKLNMYALYMEDVSEVPGNGIFAPPDALTTDEIRELVSLRAEILRDSCAGTGNVRACPQCAALRRLQPACRKCRTARC